MKKAATSVVLVYYNEELEPNTLLLLFLFCAVFVCNILNFS